MFLMEASSGFAL